MQRGLSAVEMDGVITCAGVAVRPGDYVIGDPDGAAVVPAALAAEAAAYGAEHEALEEYLRLKVSAGGPLAEFYPPSEAVRAEYEARKRRDSGGVGPWGPAGRGSPGPRGRGQSRGEGAERGGAGKDDVELYVRTYSTVLRSSGEVKLRALEAAHIRVRSSLHPGAGSEDPDGGALIYALQRLPDAVTRVRRVVLGQEGERFRALLGPGVSDWQRLEAPARRRQWRWDGAETMTVHLASSSDLDDVIPCLVAFQIEWNKLHRRLEALAREQDGGAGLDGAQPPAPEVLATLGERLGLSADDWRRLQAIWGDSFWDRLREVRAAPRDLSVRLLGGHDVGYTRLVRRWWNPIGEALAAGGLAGRPALLRLLQHARGGEPRLRVHPAPGADAVGLPGEHQGRGAAGGDRGAAGDPQSGQRGERALLRRPAVAPLPP